jgi:cytochrome c biogenesis DsbD-like protein
MKRLLLALAMAAAALAAAQTMGTPPEQYVTVAPPAKPVPVAAGAPARVEFDFRVKEGMHINSNQPRSEFLIPTALRFLPPTDIAVGKTEYPAGQDLALAFSPKDKLSVYSGDFKIVAQVSASRSASTGPYTVHAILKYQACNDKACFPPKSLPLAFNIVVGKPRLAHDAVVQSKPAASEKKNPPQSPHIHQ